MEYRRYLKEINKHYEMTLNCVAGHQANFIADELARKVANPSRKGHNWYALNKECKDKQNKVGKHIELQDLHTDRRQNKYI